MVCVKFIGIFWSYLVSTYVFYNLVIDFQKLENKFEKLNIFIIYYLIIHHLAKITYRCHPHTPTDGAIVEVFDELTIPSSHQPDVETALMKKGGRLVNS